MELELEKTQAQDIFLNVFDLDLTDCPLLLVSDLQI